MNRLVGIDLGQRRLHLVALDNDLNLVDTAVLDVAELPSLRAHLQGAQVVAVDAPETLSTAPHGDDESLSAKFRPARCAEIALGREHRIWVPWVTPTIDQPPAGWMSVGLQVFKLARTCGVEAIEVFPHAGFRVLAGGRIPSKLTAEGLRVRAELLRARGVSIEALAMWSHDSLDAALAALVAHDVAQGMAVRVGCGHDASGIFLPRAANPSSPITIEPR